MAEMNFKVVRRCRSCEGSLRPIMYYGYQPLANSLTQMTKLYVEEDKYPLTLAFCESCYLVQILETVDPEILFRDYLYFSSFSPAFVEHARVLARKTIDEMELKTGDLVVEAASNDGYLLQHYKDAGVGVLGIDPARNIAEVANKKGITTMPDFFSWKLAHALATQGQLAKVFHAHNVLAHVADTNDFVAGIKEILAPNGVAIIEVPYLGKMIPNREFDTVYHEHLCYFSVASLDKLFTRHNLQIDRVQQIPVHGGSLRVYVKHGIRGDRTIPLLESEYVLGMHLWSYFSDFKERVENLKTKFWMTLNTAKIRGRVGAYGAAAKGNTLLNYFGVKDSDILFVADRNTYKQGRLLPGSRIPVVVPMLDPARTPYVLLLTWNFKDEIADQQREFLERGGKFIVPIPNLEIISS